MVCFLHDHHVAQYTVCFAAAVTHPCFSGLCHQRLSLLLFLLVLLLLLLLLLLASLNGSTHHPHQSGGSSKDL
jgi:hypothetical protein